MNRYEIEGYEAIIAKKGAPTVKGGFVTEPLMEQFRELVGTH